MSLTIFLTFFIVLIARIPADLNSHLIIKSTLVEADPLWDVIDGMFLKNNLTFDILCIDARNEKINSLIDEIASRNAFVPIEVKQIDFIHSSINNSAVIFMNNE
jgi:hypothetical protein